MLKTLCTHIHTFKMYIYIHRSIRHSDIYSWGCFDVYSQIKRQDVHVCIQGRDPHHALIFFKYFFNTIITSLFSIDLKCIPYNHIRNEVVCGECKSAKPQNNTVLCVCFVDRCLFVLFLLAIVLSVLFRFTDSDYLPLVSSNSSCNYKYKMAFCRSLAIWTFGHSLWMCICPNAELNLINRYTR
jgi:hypothetical protein